MSISRRAVLATAAAALPAVTLLGSVHDAVAAPGTTYYIAEDGDDQAAGTSESTPWQSVNKVVTAINAGQIVRGDTIVFKRGQTFYGQFTDLSGLQGEGRITFGAYGSGEKPRIMGYKVLNKPEAWKNIGGNQWQIELVEGNYSGNTSTEDANVGFLLLDSAFHGVKKFSVGELRNDLEFHSDERNRMLTVWSEANPSTRGDLRITVNGRIFQAVSNMTIQDLDLIGCGGHGIQVRDVTGVEVLRNRIRHIGGSVLYGTTRYGNGVEVYLGGSDVLVEDNIIHDVYDVATTIQGHQILKTGREAPVLRLGSSNVHFRKNYITRCSQSFEIWVAGPEDRSQADTTSAKAGIRTCSFTDNHCEDAGIGMGLLINGGPRDDVRRILHVATEMRERQDIGELRKERGILNDDDKEEQLLNKRLCRGEMLVDEGEFVAKNGNFDELLELCDSFRRGCAFGTLPGTGEDGV